MDTLSLSRKSIEHFMESLLTGIWDTHSWMDHGSMEPSLIDMIKKAAADPDSEHPYLWGDYEYVVWPSNAIDLLACREALGYWIESLNYRISRYYDDDTEEIRKLRREKESLIILERGKSASIIATIEDSFDLEIERLRRQQR